MVNRGWTGDFVGAQRDLALSFGHGERKLKRVDSVEVKPLLLASV
jgi:hypothetical protein